MLETLHRAAGSSATPLSAPPRPVRWPGRARTVVAILLVVATGLVYGQTARHEFVNYDDDQYVYANPTVLKGLTARGVLDVFTHFYSNNIASIDEYHPLTWLAYMLDCQIYGVWPGGHHLTNLLLHAATSVLLLLALERMTGQLWPSAFVAALFAVHPLRVESVAWIAELKDVLSGLFFVLTLWAYVDFVRKPYSHLRICCWCCCMRAACCASPWA